jgi:hypothetical protein
MQDLGRTPSIWDVQSRPRASLAGPPAPRDGIDNLSKTGESLGREVVRPPPPDRLVRATSETKRGGPALHDVSTGEPE